jgi:hypothetical protein
MASISPSDATNGNAQTANSAVETSPHYTQNIAASTTNASQAEIDDIEFTAGTVLTQISPGTEHTQNSTQDDDMIDTEHLTQTNDDTSNENWQKVGTKRNKATATPNKPPGNRNSNQEEDSDEESTIIDDVSEIPLEPDHSSKSPPAKRAAQKPLTIAIRATISTKTADIRHGLNTIMLAINHADADPKAYIMPQRPTYKSRSGRTLTTHNWSTKIGIPLDDNSIPRYLQGKQADGTTTYRGTFKLHTTTNPAQLCNFVNDIINPLGHTIKVDKYAGKNMKEIGSLIEAGPETNRDDLTAEIEAALLLQTKTAHIVQLILDAPVDLSHPPKTKPTHRRKLTTIKVLTPSNAVMAVTDALCELSKNGQTYNGRHISFLPNDHSLDTTKGAKLARLSILARQKRFINETRSRTVTNLLPLDEPYDGAPFSHTRRNLIMMIETENPDYSPDAPLGSDSSEIDIEIDITKLDSPEFLFVAAERMGTSGHWKLCYKECHQPQVNAILSTGLIHALQEIEPQMTADQLYINPTEEDLSCPRGSCGRQTAAKKAQTYLEQICITKNITPVKAPPSDNDVPQPDNHGNLPPHPPPHRSYAAATMRPGRGGRGGHRLSDRFAPPPPHHHHRGTSSSRRRGNALSAEEIQATWAEYYKTIEDTNDLAEAYYDHVEQMSMEQRRRDTESGEGDDTLNASPRQQQPSSLRRNLFSSSFADAQANADNVSKASATSTTPTVASTAEITEVVEQHLAARDRQYQDKQTQFLANQVERDRQLQADILRAVQEQQLERDRAQSALQQHQEQVRMEQQERALQEYRSKTEDVVTRLDNLEEFIRLCMSNSNQAPETQGNAGAHGTST